MSTPPENIKRDDGGGFRPNPNWYEGTGWRFDPGRANENHPDSNVEARLSLRCESGGGVALNLTDAQIAKLLYAAQAGELDDYGDGHD